ncbi:hypothetical protein TRIATDRAFT_298605 [Trichoderma atroviride IMI 206040]|uniref:Uncharacterized protein n=1 Tax=Hypocrea atroviridis (strain ATCC 20476 / IMI 206040) TaxID=452589 RepID=G9NPK5_HYPAI|nr:uncharacterized protein TRIATDRAFT_298605 [Trichoderma atroviride IMI 206040]EHK47472.1 hypothetical protein TRIATDRAFT_298605 [Trichoderma atroviride IMI 206040]
MDSTLTSPAHNGDNRVQQLILRSLDLDSVYPPSCCLKTALRGFVRRRINHVVPT